MYAARRWMTAARPATPPSASRHTPLDSRLDADDLLQKQQPWLERPLAGEPPSVRNGVHGRLPAIAFRRPTIAKLSAYGAGAAARTRGITAVPKQLDRAQQRRVLGRRAYSRRRGAWPPQPPVHRRGGRRPARTARRTAPGSAAPSRARRRCGPSSGSSRRRTSRAARSLSLTKPIACRPTFKVSAAWPASASRPRLVRTMPRAFAPLPRTRRRTWCHSSRRAASRGCRSQGKGDAGVVRRDRNVGLLSHQVRARTPMMGAKWSSCRALATGLVVGDVQPVLDHTRPGGDAPAVRPFA